ncbi:MAG: glycosyltransferase, partial [Anaerolineae bacterium]|nr:glycosyltransferase [Anaerolineae bacterium]
GVGNALNVATKEATGDLIHYLHSDDYYLNNESLEKVASRFVENPNLVWLTGNFLVEVSGKRISVPQTYLLRANLEIAISVMNIISHENTFMKREAVQMYGGFNESKNDVVEYGLWLNLIKDHKPLIVNDEFTVFIIHNGSKSTGNLLKFSKALLRAFHTQRKEMIFPLLGYYADKSFYKLYRQIIKKVVKFESLLDIEDL